MDGKKKANLAERTKKKWMKRIENRNYKLHKQSMANECEILERNIYVQCTVYSFAARGEPF